MDERYLKKLLDLHKQYCVAKSICDPIDYVQRQRDLLYMLADVALMPLNDYLERKLKGEIDNVEIKDEFNAT